MAEISWTASQRQAIESTGRGILVTAAAGSGKTAVLSERCASLVAEARPPCALERVLVVTFTDAAAAEMRARIAAALRARLARRPGDAWIARQLDLVDAAPISTIHAFCRRLLNRYFAQADLDPQAPILDEADARLMRGDAVQRVFDELAQREDAEGEAFTAILESYAPTGHTHLQRIVLSLHAFIASLTEPDGWMQEALRRYEGATAEKLSPYWIERLHAALVEELSRQRVAVSQNVEQLRPLGPAVSSHVGLLSEYVEALASWEARAREATSAPAIDGLCEEIRAWSFPDVPRKSKKTCPPGGEDAFAIGGSVARFARDLFNDELVKNFARFKVADWAEGIARTAPHVRKLLRLVEMTGAEYRRAKEELGVVDFNDLERKTLELLRDEAAGVTARLRGQFDHVLVDEFQDINPVQAEILRLVSREGDAPRPSNLFTVGDVKQSIYRFRLAEPRLFLARQAALAARGPDDGLVVALTENFRSRPRLLEALNAVFERLFAADLGGIDYDERARLRPPPAAADAQDGPVVDVEILDDAAAAGADDGENDHDSDVEDWQRIEREAFVVAQKIAECRAAGFEHRDIVVLLRSMQERAGLFVRTLRRLGVPARTEDAGGFFDSLEVQDVLAVLAILDNSMQDIPLATVLRSPVFGGLSDAELIEIRTADRAAGATAFHAAVSAYAETGNDEALRARLRAMFERLERWRTRARMRPLAEVLWEIYQESGALAFVSGLRDGLQRRANLLRLHEYARRFGAFQRQGLYRFLRFMDSLRDAGDDLAGGTVAAHGPEVVRVMTIHKSKGLEFPVVIVAELGKRFNFSDAVRSIIYDRRLGVGLDAIDVEKRIAYPTLPKRLVNEALSGEMLAEEMRVLYVALTRAKRRLVLVGTKRLSKLDEWRTRFAGHAGPLPAVDRAKAQSLVDWVLPALYCSPGLIENADAAGSAAALVRLRTYGAADMQDWVLDPRVDSGSASRLEACARLEPLEVAAGGLPVGSPSHGVVATVQRRLCTAYPAAALTRVPAVAAASAIKQRWNTLADSEEPAEALPSLKKKPEFSMLPSFRVPGFVAEASSPEPTELGTAVHLFFELVDLHRPCDGADLAAQLKQLTEAGRLSAAERRLVDVDDAAWFFSTPLGERMRSAARVMREWPFVIGAAPTRYDRAATPRGDDDLMLVRGIIDCMFAVDGDWEIVDYKTDRVAGAALEERARLYSGQLDVYAQAVETTLGRSANERHLVFLRARRIVSFGSE